MNKLYTYAETAAAARCSPATLARRIRSGTGPRLTAQGRLRFVSQNDLADWLNSLRA